MIGAVVHLSGLRANALPILGFAGAILVARWVAVNLSRWTWKGISRLARGLIVLLLPRGLITAVLAIQVIEQRGTDFVFLRSATFVIILVTNMLLVLGSVLARRTTALAAVAERIPE